MIPRKVQFGIALFRFYKVFGEVCLSTSCFYKHIKQTKIFNTSISFVFTETHFHFLLPYFIIFSSLSSALFSYSLSLLIPLHFISFHFTFHFISLHFFSLLIPLHFILHISLLLILLPRVHWLLCSACLKHLKLQVHLNEMIWKQACLLRLSSSSRRRQEDDIVVRAPDKLASAQTIWGRMWTSLPPLTPVSCIMYHYSGFICVYSQ